ncbi:PH domain-containing protein [Microbacterium sp. NPDC055910]|uniref:PH domain-containing protein n=1 Tax=Microbacterium sp. NPDC055910 TaxID=3345659 RepID=UPI0035D670A6
MTGIPAEGPPPPARRLVRSPLSDGEWHRMHPLTPLLRGGFALVVVAGIIIANFRDRLIELFLPAMDGYGDYSGDPIDWVVSNDLLLVALFAVLGVVILLIGVFYVSWRFHTFRITGDDVEVRSGVLFRTHRRAPLDRVQGVNLTRPMIARLLGLAKLEVVGAGLDSNVKLEYLSTPNAEAVRADILRLASGAQLGDAAPDAAGPSGSRVSAAASIVSAGISGIIDGADQSDVEPESVVHIPVGRLIGSQLLSGSTIALVLAIIAIIVGSIFGTPWILFGMVPAAIGFGAYWARSITRSLRYSIAPTSSGVRITFGLFTTITEILPPGRVHAVQVSQSILWRRFGWWAVSVNRLSGRSATDVNSDQFATVLPVGTRADVERVLGLLLPGFPQDDWPLVIEQGLLRPSADDPFTTTPRRARLLRPLSWRRNGFQLTPHALLVRRGAIWRKLGIFPLARLQSVAIAQGPVDRRLRIANLQPHTILGPVSGALGIIDRDAVLDVFGEVIAAANAAAAVDSSHRWAGRASALADQVAAESADAGPGTWAPGAGAGGPVVTPDGGAPTFAEAGPAAGAGAAAGAGPAAEAGPAEDAGSSQGAGPAAEAGPAEGAGLPQADAWAPVSAVAAPDRVVPDSADAAAVEVSAGEAEAQDAAGADGEAEEPRA